MSKSLNSTRGQVSSTTNNVDVSNGQMTSYNNSSLSQAATAPSDAFSNKSGFQSHEDSFIVRNVPRFLHAAVECLVGGNWAAIYVDPDQHIGTMDQQLTPMNEVRCPSGHILQVNVD